MLPLARISTPINRRADYEFQKPNMDEWTFEVDGDMNEMTNDWSLEEFHDSRRIVDFRKVYSGPLCLNISFSVFTAGVMLHNGLYISCIKRDDDSSYYITQDDIIRLIEWLLTWFLPYRLSAEEKSQILQILDDFNPLTVSKVKAETEDLFKLIMSLSKPQLTDLEVQIEVHRWETLLPALRKMLPALRRIIDQSRASLNSRKNIPNKPSVNTALLSTSTDTASKTAYKLENSSSPEINPDKRPIYISELARSFISIAKGLAIVEDALNRVSDTLPNLLEAFALRIGRHKASTPMHYSVMNFVFEYRQ